MMNRDEVQEKIELNTEQRKAFNAFIRAVKRCKKEGVFFYSVLGNVGGLNGENVDDIMTIIEFPNADSNHPSCLQYMDFPKIYVVAEFADDNHFVKFKDSNQGE